MDFFRVISPKFMPIIISGMSVCAFKMSLKRAKKEIDPCSMAYRTASLNRSVSQRLFKSESCLAISLK